jgi:hypothetical protein
MGETIMFKRTLTASALAIVISTPAIASHCPMDAKAIDNALQRTSLTDTQKAEVKALRDEGMNLHGSGEHRKSEQTLAKAMRMLLEVKLK